MIREYAVVNGALLQDVVDDVNKRIGEGWQPLGGICVAHVGHYQFYSQAVVYTAPVETVINVQNTAYREGMAALQGDEIVRDAGGA